MSALLYFGAAANAAVLSTQEIASVNTSIRTLNTRLGRYFGSGIAAQLRFGSSMRGTILPRKLDEKSDIDYMIVFTDFAVTPQTHLNRLKRFSDVHYSSSSFKQSNPTIVLELNHIKFDLVPALLIGSALNIPDAAGGWQTTDPHGFSQQLQHADALNGGLLKPAIRLVKSWNADRGYVFESFGLEKWMAQLAFVGCANLRDYVLFAFGEMRQSWVSTQWQKDEIARAQNLASSVQLYERHPTFATARSEAKKLIPTV